MALLTLQKSGYTHYNGCSRFYYLPAPALANFLNRSSVKHTVIIHPKLYFRYYSELPKCD